MRRKFVMASALVLLWAASPALAASPFGSFGGAIDGSNAGGGFLGLFGWALDDDGIDHVDIYVDGVPMGRADYGRNRPGVTAQFPGYPDSDRAGFAFTLDTTQFLNGNHTLTAKVFSRTGEETFLNSKVVDVNNTVHSLVPFGAIDFPRPSAELRGNCDLADQARRYSVVSGYALDKGIENGDRGVKWVELMINGTIWAQSHVDCRYSVPEGGLSDCFGLPRLDIEKRYPTVQNSLHSGFRFVLDVGFLIGLGYSRGYHEITIRAGDKIGNVADIAEIPVTFGCDEDIKNEKSFGWIDFPLPNQILSGISLFGGWALDWEGVKTIHMYIDGVEKSVAAHGQLNPDISSLYPGYPESAAPGWIWVFDTTTISDGLHGVQVVIEDDLGDRTIIGERNFFVDNDLE